MTDAVTQHARAVREVSAMLYDPFRREMDALCEALWALTNDGSDSSQPVPGYMSQAEKDADMFKSQGTVKGKLGRMVDEEDAVQQPPEHMRCRGCNNCVLM
eukprot:TRINITY_DN325_c0_g1_i10.p2 TRINITY_DN325_c0_g1~~TRINITY_DN325_c0_g1_i10.p2  ORF type:complete len:101 (-),score=17.81 TRINITY_DN325_c0_g1_i10:291-593(-)